MSSKVLVVFAALCLIGSCRGAKEAKPSKQSLTRQEDISIEQFGASSNMRASDSDPDIKHDPGFWRLWKFWKWGRTMMQNVFKRSSDMAKSAAGRHRAHQDQRRKLKNKVKFLFKIHQYAIDYLSCFILFIRIPNTEIRRPTLPTSYSYFLWIFY
ncbi:hypothetical protein NE865_13313 [Phthorimaea operculella]|nr:hypothetical protein NE865_13313 [Phthorimaea operculella]